MSSSICRLRARSSTAGCARISRSARRRSRISPDETIRTRRTRRCSRGRRPGTDFWRRDEAYPVALLRTNDCVAFQARNPYEKEVYYQTERAKRKFTFASLPTGGQASGVPVKSGQYPAACPPSRRGWPRRDWVQGLPWGLIPVIFLYEDVPIFEVVPLGIAHPQH